MDKALEAAERLAKALHAKHYSEVTQWRPLTGDLVGLITQIDNMTSCLSRAALPATDTSGLVGIMRDKAAGRRNRVGDPWGDHFCAEAADHIEALERRLAEAEAALAFVARMAWRTDPPNATGKVSDAERFSAIKHHPTVKTLAKPHIALAEAEARSYLEGRK